MRSKEILGLVAVSLIIAAVIGAVTRAPAALIGAFFLIFAVLFALYYRWSARERKEEPPTESMLEEARAARTMSAPEAYNPDISGESPDEDPIRREDVIRSYMERFQIPRSKAENLYLSGYRRWGDFSEAIPEDLMLVGGINPTIAKRIIQTTRTK